MFGNVLDDGLLRSILHEGEYYFLVGGVEGGGAGEAVDGDAVSVGGGAVGERHTGLVVQVAWPCGGSSSDVGSWRTDVGWHDVCVVYHARAV